MLHYKSVLAQLINRPMGELYQIKIYLEAELQFRDQRVGVDSGQGRMHACCSCMILLRTTFYSRSHN